MRHQTIPEKDEKDHPRVAPLDVAGAHGDLPQSGHGVIPPFPISDSASKLAVEIDGLSASLDRHFVHYERVLADQRALKAINAEMLIALKDTLDYWDMTGFSDCAEECDCIVQSVQKAIAKAEGAA